MKVLIIEPDWRFAQQATAFLESHAHLTVHETTAEGGLAKASHWQPDLVIAADVFAEDGLLESLADVPDKPAVLLTGWMDRYDVAWRAWQRGGDELLMKPVFRAEELHGAIITAMENATAGTRGSQLPTTATA
ncbi:MAG: response regulator [Planctomycetaceae bacterium]|nr:response regulator [Planctomycetaceae bacterium]